MFAKTIIDSDAFLDMPCSSQALYFHLGMRADDEGFINNAKKIQRMVGASDDDLKILVIKGFIIPFDSGICVIKDWRIHNYIKNDRYQPTQYVVEKSQLRIANNKTYELNGTQMEPDCIQNVSNLEPQVRLGKDRLELGKYRDRGTGEETPPHAATAQLDYEAYRNVFISACPSLPAPNKSNKWNAARKKAIRDKCMSVEEIGPVFERVEESDFLSGRSGKWQGCSIDWILKPANWQKIIEGNYDNRDSVQHGRETSYDLDAYEKQSIFDSEVPND